MTSRPRTRVCDQAPFRGVTDWYPSQVIENQVMAASVISISSDVSVESVGSSFPRVILIGSIPVEVPVAPKVKVAAVASPAGVLELDTHSSSKVDPSESSPPLISVAPMVLPFMCSDDSESDTEILERHVSPSSHDAMLTRWRSKVASRSSSTTNSTLEIPTSPILPIPSAIEDIPIGRLYRNHPGGPCKALTTRKSARPLPSHRLALRYTSYHLDHFISESSSSYSSLDHSLSGHTPLDTTDADSSTPHRFVHSSCDRTPRCSTYPRWRSAPLSIMYPLTTSELSVGDSSSESSASPSRKRCRSPAAIMTSSIHATKALVPSRADLLPPRKRFRDCISPEDNVEEDIDTDVLEDIEADATVVKVAVDMDVEARVDASIDMEVDVRIGVEDEVEDEVEAFGAGQRELESRSMIDNGERASLLEQVASLERINLSLRGTIMMERARADSNGNGGNGNDGNGNGGNGNPNENNRDARHVAREYTYQDFMKCQPLNFKETEGVVGLISALTWWNSHKRTIGAEAAFSMLWRELMKLMAENNDLAAYTQRFQELTMMCTKMVPEEEDQVEKFIGGLPDNIQGNVIAAEPTKLQDAIRIANNLMDQKLEGYAMKNAENKRRLEINQRDNRRYKPPFKRPNIRGQNVARVYTTGNNERKPYNGLFPLCNKCKLHHKGPCTVRCGKCNK
ncbi:hypothetical protein Tco_1152269, partial [Tanacetum coccineum]